MVIINWRLCDEKSKDIYDKYNTNVKHSVLPLLYCCRRL